MLEYIPFVGTLVDLGSKAYVFFSDAWDFLTTPLPGVVRSSVLAWILEKTRGLDLLPDTPIDFILGGIGFIIVVKIIRLFWDALPWV